jgi:hypothetical protein
LPTSRATVSTGPPAGVGTMILIGRAGKGCAWPGSTTPGQAPIAAKRATRARPPVIFLASDAGAAG